MPSLATLDPLFRPHAESFFVWARRQFPGLVVTSARRTRAEQQKLWEAYQRGENDGLPAARPGTSDHEAGFAMDLARLNTKALNDGALRALGAAWVAGGGRWSEKDPVHFAAPKSMAR